MKITDIECHVLLVPDVRKDVTSSAQDDIVVRVHTDEGITGIGESDVNPWIARACIEAPSTHTMGLGLKDMLIGENPLDTERLWEKLYVGSCISSATLKWISGIPEIWTQHEKIVAAGRGDRQRTLGHLLSPYVTVVVLILGKLAEQIV